jgi:hypothetical protein
MRETDQMEKSIASILPLLILITAVFFLGRCSAEKEAPELPKPPTITGFSPAGGVMGSTVTITGTNFSATPTSNAVKLNDMAAVVLAAQATQLQVAVPEGAVTGKFTVTVNASSAVSGESFTVLDFSARLTVKGLYVLFEQRGYPNGYMPGQAIQEFNNFDAVVGHTVKEEISWQLDEMKLMGVNTITFDLRTSDSYYDPGPFIPPVCNVPPVLGFQYPNPTQTEIANLAALFDLVADKGMKILLRLSNTHMEEQPPINNKAWLDSILNAVKSHPALELVLFEGTTHLVDTNGDGIGDACGIPAEPPLWLGPRSKPAEYVKWAIQNAMGLGLPAYKLSAEAIVGDYFVNTEPAAGPAATDRHLWKPIRVLKGIFDELSIPENQRTYALSFYEHRKCQSVAGIQCPDADPHTWADETLKQVFETIGRHGSRVIAVEMGLLRADPNWSTPQAFESLVLLMKRYGVAGGCFWRWTFFYDDENLDPTQATPVKKRGLNFIYNPVKDMIAKYYLDR